MEKISHTIKQISTKSLLPISTKTQGYVKKTDCTEVSVFQGGISKKHIWAQLNRLKEIFPDLDEYFLKELKEAFINNGFTDERIEQSVNHVINTCHYKKPYIALFIDFDIRFKVYSFEQFREMIYKNGRTLYGKYSLVKLPNKEKGYYVKNEDIERYGLQLFSDYKDEQRNAKEHQN